MTEGTWALILVEAGAAALVLTGERMDRRSLQWIAKPAASLCFVAIAWLAHATESSYGIAILAALVLSLAGDALLIPREPVVFRAGIVVFLLAHVAFMGAFALASLDWRAVAISLLALVPAAILIGRQILPHVPRALKGAVLAYMVVISAMVALAAGAAWGGARWWILLPAAAFYANDVLVAQQRFVAPAFWRRVVGLPLYYAAQTAFALSVP